MTRAGLISMRSATSAFSNALIIVALIPLALRRHISQAASKHVTARPAALVP